MGLKNQEIAQILYEMAALYEMQNIEFKPRAYEKAAQGVESYDKEIEDLVKEKGEKGLLQIPGVGAGIAEHIAELLKTGKLQPYENLKKKYPVNLAELLAIEGIGPKTIKTLYQKLGVKNAKDLKVAAEKQLLRKLEGFGKKSEENILKALKFYDEQPKRFLLGYMRPQVEKIKAGLTKSGYFKKIEVCGSYRRMQETIGDIDILATSKNPARAMQFFVKQGDAAAVLEHGSTKSEIRLGNGLQIDLRIVPEESWGAALQYFTGDKAHNVKVRKIAIAKGLKLSEYGLFKGKKNIAASTEEAIYAKLGMDCMPPELRTDSGEIEAAQKHQLPKLLEYGSIQGDLQVQSCWTDGENTIEEMATAARDAGLEYIAITDHTKSLAMTGGLDEKKLIQQMTEIDNLNKKFKVQNSKFKILKGAEVNIMKDGSLDINDETLRKLDLVGVSVHSHFKMTRKEMTVRLRKALSHPKVNIFFHPTTRLIQKREPIDFDFSEILKVAKKNQVAMEVNSYPERLDLHDTMIRQAVVAGVKLAIDSDAHSIKHFKFLYLGEAQARRGWATKNDILNTKSVDELLKYFAKR